ncbi:tail fiber protein [Providencia huaxiensis]|nr:tail fiber protein [Providencia huaxiensis]MBQ0588735.1 tail fiber protein [Providencia huaxiensis]
MSQDAATKSFIRLGQYGWGGIVTDYVADSTNESSIASFLRNTSTVASIYRFNASTALSYQYSPFIYAKAGNTFSGLTASHTGAGVKVIGGYDAGNPIVYEVYTDKNATVDRNGNLKLVSSNELTDYPVGAPIPWPQSTTPAGYLVCNGQTFNKSTYPLLAKAYPTGALPDLRSEFIRGLDAGRNIDSNRSVLSSQSDALQRITGRFGRFKAVPSATIADGAFQVTGTTGGSDDNTGSGPSDFDFDSARVTRSADETRPRNIAFLYIVRAA